MKITLCMLAVGIVVVQMPGTAVAEEPNDTFPGAEWQTIAPDAVGFSPERLAEVQEYFEDIGGDAMVAVRHGKMFIQWGDIEEPIVNYSIRKSYLNALLGMEYGQDNLNLNSSLADLGIDDKENLTAAEQKARVHDLLTSSSGVYHPGSYESKEQAGARPPRGTFGPGEFFYYNNWDFNVVGHIFETSAGTGIFTALQKRIAEPLGMQDFTLEMTKYRKDDASNYPAYIFASSARDDARFGYLYLRNGRWRDEQIVPADWVEMSTTKQVTTGEHYYYDYGYLWWVDSEHGAYFARGNSGQFIAVLPGLDLVIVFRADPGSIVQKWLGRRVLPEESFLLIPKILGSMARGR